jgi:putative phosphoesterase
VIRVGVVADTHSPEFLPELPGELFRRLRGVDLILHAGDVVCRELLDELSGFAPTLAVLGNNDAALVGTVPEERLITVEGLRIGMIHDSGVSKGREGRLRRRFPTADVVVFGHSHIPVDTEGIDGQRLFNPGSPTERRRQPVHTVGRLVIDGADLVDHAIVPV